VALRRRRGRQNEADVTVGAEPLEPRKTLDLATLAARPPAVREEERIAGVDDEVRLVRADAPHHVVEDVVAKETRVLERDVALVTLDVPVARVQQVEDRLETPRAGNGDVAAQRTHRRLELFAARQRRLGGGLGVEPGRRVVGACEQDDARAQRTKQVEVARSVVIGVPQRGEVLVDAVVRADDERKRGARLGVRSVGVRASERDGDKAQRHERAARPVSVR
jgi:hypothetical protein